MPAPDVTQWTDDELERELKAWQAGGDNARIAAQWAYRVAAEAETRRAKKSAPQSKSGDDQWTATSRSR